MAGRYRGVSEAETRARRVELEAARMRERYKAARLRAEASRKAGRAYASNTSEETRHRVSAAANRARKHPQRITNKERRPRKEAA